MVFTIEPGVYDGELGGFRHSDTALVTPDGYRAPHLVPDRDRRADDPRLSYSSSTTRWTGTGERRWTR